MTFWCEYVCGNSTRHGRQSQHYKLLCTVGVLLTVHAESERGKGEVTYLKFTSSQTKIEIETGVENLDSYHKCSWLMYLHISYLLATEMENSVTLLLSSSSSCLSPFLTLSLHALLFLSFRISCSGESWVRPSSSKVFSYPGRVPFVRPDFSHYAIQLFKFVMKF